MKTLRFTIRTWNRLPYLKRCLERIIEEVSKVGAEKDVVIFVIDNHCTDGTTSYLKNLQKEVPYLVVHRWEKWCKMGEFLPIPEEVMKKIKSKFTWSMGDDDILISDAFLRIWNFLNTEKAEDYFLIAVGNGELKPHSYKTYEATVLDFCNLMGANQFIGWGSAIITNLVYEEELLEEKEEEVKIFKEKYAPLYAKTAFAHVLRFLHLYKDEPAIFFDYPTVEPMEDVTKNPKKIKEDGERWERENVGWKYFLYAKALKKMFDDGILEKKLKPMFFKYLEGFLWNRFLGEMIASRLGIYTRNPRPDEGWDIILDIAEIIDDPVIAQDLRRTVFLARELCREYLFLKEKVEESPELKERLEEVKNSLLSAYNETLKPLFPKGWAGKGYREYKISQEEE